MHDTPEIAQPPQTEAQVPQTPQPTPRPLGWWEWVGAGLRAALCLPVHIGHASPGPLQLVCLLAFSVAAQLGMAIPAFWAAIGLVVYFGYSRKHSHVGRGHVEVHEEDADIPPQPVPPLPGASLD